MILRLMIMRMKETILSFVAFLASIEQVKYGLFHEKHANYEYDNYEITLYLTSCRSKE